MAKVLTKELLREAIETVKEVYLEDRIPWICGYSGGKDSSATVQLVWMALREIPPEKRAKTRYHGRVPRCGALGEKVPSEDEGGS